MPKGRRDVSSLLNDALSNETLLWSWSWFPDLQTRSNHSIFFLATTSVKVWWNSLHWVVRYPAVEKKTKLVWTFFRAGVQLNRWRFKIISLVVQDRDDGTVNCTRLVSRVVSEWGWLGAAVQTTTWQSGWHGSRSSVQRVSSRCSRQPTGRRHVGARVLNYLRRLRRSRPGRGLRPGHARVGRSERRIRSTIPRLLNRSRRLGWRSVAAIWPGADGGRQFQGRLLSALDPPAHPIIDALSNAYRFVCAVPASLSVRLAR